jgi:hypothetical protein
MRKITKDAFKKRCSEMLKRFNLESIDREEINIIDDDGLEWINSKTTAPTASTVAPDLKHLEIHLQCYYIVKNGVKGLRRIKWKRYAWIYRPPACGREAEPIGDGWFGNFY